VTQGSRARAAMAPRAGARSIMSPSAVRSKLNVSDAVRRHISPFCHTHRCCLLVFGCMGHCSRGGGVLACVLRAALINRQQGSRRGGRTTYTRWQSCDASSSALLPGIGNT
jgi:hypothetical protein